MTNQTIEPVIVLKNRSIDTIWQLSDTMQFTANVMHDSQIKRYVVTIYRSELETRHGVTIKRTIMHDPLNLRWIEPCKRYSERDLAYLSHKVSVDERVLRNLALAIAELAGEELCDECGAIHDPNDIVTIYGVSNES